MSERKPLALTSMILHILAMVFMLFDHLWATIVPGNDWMTCVGRIAFPIFAFLIVEGYFHTGNLKKYVLRLLVFALISEIPFNLVMGGRIFYPLHQNVLWTFLIAIGLIYLNEKAKHAKLPRRILRGAATVIIGYFVGVITFVDFYNSGILIVLMFYFLRGRKWWNLVGQILILAYICEEMVGGLSYELAIGDTTFFVARQSFALLALIPIWLYKGKQGPYNKGLRILYYAFYPAHLLVLGLLNFL
ncbi:MAG: conjugal transfer protein TraX [Clostridiales bacterium]|nr:conjugal transfer protein TraX [Clostridiales bacterium]